jgi:hypothetical protein
MKFHSVLKTAAALCLFTALMCLSIQPAAAQFTTAVLNGTITDASGAVVPEARVTVRNMDTNFELTFTTGSAGTYVFPRLPVGRYALRVEKPGFAPYAQEGITLTVSQTATQDVSLKVGGTTSQVTVSAEAGLVTTTTAQVGQLIDDKRILELPLNGRNAQGLVFLAAGTADVTTRYCGLNCMGGVYPGEQQAAVNGSGPGQVNYQLDGVNHNDSFLNMNLPFPNPDSVQEFSLQTSNLSAEYGNSASGTVNVVTKSGTNQIHGSGFEFLRNGDLNARNFFGGAPDTLKRNQFGGSVGGPIKKDKLFFFGTYQGTRMNYASGSNYQFVPTELERQGDFSQSGVTLVDPKTNQPLPGDIIPPEMMSPAAKFFLNQFPLPNGPGRKYTYTGPSQNQRDDQYLGKIDYVRGRSQLSGRYFYSEFQEPVTVPKNNLLLTTNQGGQVRVQNIALNHTFTFSPTVLFNTAFGWSQQVGGSISSAPFDITASGITIAAPPNPEIYFWVDGGPSIDTNHKGNFNRGDWSLRENATWVKGKHEIHIGAEAARLNNTLRNTFMQSGEYGFSNAYSGDSLADFMMGNASYFTQGSGELKDMVGTNWAAFVQDNWRTTQRLTLNLGLRWDPFVPYTETKGRVACFVPGLQSSRYPNAPAGMIFGGDPGCPSGSGVNSSMGDFAPRFGFAYRLTNDGKTSIRGGIGYYYSAEPSDYFFSHFNWPFNPSVFIPNANFDNPFGAAGVANPFPAAWTQIPGPDTPYIGGSLSVVDPGFKPAQFATWNLSFERQLAGSLLLRAAYVGNHATHLATTFKNSRDINAMTPGLTWDDNRRPYGASFGDISMMDGSNTSRYDSFQFTAEKRMSHGFSILGSYTRQRAMDDFGWFDPFNRSYSWGPSDDNLTNNVKFSSVWSLPNAPIHGFAGKVVNGWQLNSIVNWHSGFPVNIVAGGNRSGMGNFYADFADYVGGNVSLSQSRSHGEMVKQFFNTAAFAPNQKGQLGTATKNMVEGPRSFNADLALVKQIQFRESTHLDLRFEGFNAFNNVNFGTPKRVVTAPSNFGQLVSAQAGRVLQMAAKFYF